MKREIVEKLKEYDDGAFLSYFETVVLPEYETDKGHGSKHIDDVLERTFALIKNLKLELDEKIISAAVFYHDIGRKINDENHEKISAQLFLADEKMKLFFDEEQRKIIVEAIEDHRASMEGQPRNVYGKLLSSADRNTKLEQPLQRTYDYRHKKEPDWTFEKIMQEAFIVLNKKFGRGGYADRVYFDDGVYQNYLTNLRVLLDNYDLFQVEYKRINQKQD